MKIDLFINAMNRAINRSEFDDLCTSGCDKSTIRCASVGLQARWGICYGLNGPDDRAYQFSFASLVR